MGLSPFKKCFTNKTPQAKAPDPSRWERMDLKICKNGYAMRVKYLDCTNYEGVKIMVYEGDYQYTIIRDPHFHGGIGSPIARFKPDKDGWKRAVQLAISL